MTKVHALIIDDNAENIEVLGRLLSANGVTHTDVQDTTRLKMVLQDLAQVNVIFLDLEMPKQNGYEILGILKNLLGNELPIVACTVHTNEIVAAQEVGFDGFIAKPLNPQLFSSQLSRILNGEPVWDAS